MPTHIFLALGMWDEVVSQNELASGRDRAIWAPNHYTQWLGYGYLQQGRYDTAQRHLELMRRNAEKGMRGRAVLAQMRAEYVVNSERWDCPCLQWDIDLTTVRARDAAVDLLTIGLSALRRGERAGAERALADLVTLNGNRAPLAPGHERDEVPDIVQLELQALLRQAGGATDEAVRLMREAAVLEDRMPAEFGPPPDVKPAHELFGELLLEAGRAAEAQREFARALALAPRSEEHTSELQSRLHLVCRLLLEKKKAEINADTNRDRVRCHITARARAGLEARDVHPEFVVRRHLTPAELYRELASVIYDIGRSK